MTKGKGGMRQKSLCDKGRGGQNTSYFIFSIKRSKINRGVGQKVNFHSEGGGGLRQKVTLHDMGGARVRQKVIFLMTMGVKSSG